MTFCQPQLSSWKLVQRIHNLNHLRVGLPFQKRKLNSLNANEKRLSGINACPKDCLCQRSDVEISYKNVRLLSQFVSSQTGMILPRKITKVCMKKQKEISKAIKLARAIGFMPETYKAADYLEDPKLFN